MSTLPEKAAVVHLGRGFGVTQDHDGLWFIGEALEKRFLWWKWIVWVNVAVMPDTRAEVVFATRRDAVLHFDDMQRRGLFMRRSL